MSRLNLTIFLITISVFAALHYVSLELYLYWRFPWLDIPMHFIGGAVVALSPFALRELRLPVPRVLLSLKAAIIFVFIVALLWEVFEFSLAIAFANNYLFDTLGDLTVGLLGGFVGHAVATRINTFSL
ncbi:hypothetical protein KC722_01660 [Candidatus Kaiserbacteria bacterium]|nr:hypothetical protein [Candidatus Kaiserbacteria bacterium]MCB9811388.1 hypothetical protein [Candidatus Nomurabacteria bacterium]